MSQNKIISILTTSEDYKSIIKLNSTIYSKLANKYGNIYIINLNNLLFLNKKEKKNRSSTLKSNIKIFKPKNIGLLFYSPNNQWLRTMINVAGTVNFDWVINNFFQEN